MYISEWIYWPDPTKFRETIAASMAMGELWKKHGATDARLSSLNGSDMGCLANTITFENAEAFGKASDTINTDSEAGKLMGALASLGGEWVRHNLYRSIGG